MKKLNLFILVLIFLTGCAEKKSDLDPVKNELLAYTQKFESINEEKRYLAVSTYLNPVLKNSDKEIFILSSYPKEESILLDSVNINNDFDLNITKLDFEDELLKMVNINIPWSNHYKITSHIKDNDYLTLSYKTQSGINANLKFLKVSKSMYWNPQIKFNK
ncbi:hypothetical protein CYJ41_06115 [Campylobacter ureolyticus]|uniref:Lipoprotein n=1 Tax=Campylobacter ureolyticus TaxID=827 RepID=A0A2I1N9E3_9BACT|nr:hypothetical protein [Campylobacter ureolyticus]MCZ6156717.1 hypothetical protein [Campylobacter ureolyticus]PKZ29003.1 hypothetical protein CYJ41_06115 [Campylobacter ureolyticus]